MFWLSVLAVGKIFLYFFLGVFAVGGLVGGWLFLATVEKGYFPELFDNSADGAHDFD